MDDKELKKGEEVILQFKEIINFISNVIIAKIWSLQIKI